MKITLDFRITDLTAGVERIRETVPDLGPDDQLTIIIEATDAHEHETDEILRELRRHGLEPYARGAGGNTYNIIAKRLH